MPKSKHAYKWKWTHNFFKAKLNLILLIKNSFQSFVFKEKKKTVYQKKRKKNYYGEQKYFVLTTKPDASD